ncbi:EF-hand calcium-binding domain-containing protein 13 [Erinaceus europaeus]|uniref:EF-hand calcium-binding domain-containing protein 13 n=1 Tax=Erinaceus europaeus TaxID=9365 RepID=A0ABM3YBM2_ERIEU|nr:EF-hand calcium-binding domain-containing protein 13 [Erinaceus europaeus]
MQFRYETSTFLCGEEKFCNLSGGKKVRKKKSLKVQLHSERTETASTSVTFSKVTSKKESLLCKLADRHNIHKTLSPLHPSSSNIWKKKDTSSLYETIYDNIPLGQLKLQQFNDNALQKACTIFRKIRRGKIYINDLPMIHHILKVPVSDSEMRMALKVIDIDANGTLDFSDYLNALSAVCRFIPQDPAFQDTLKMFSGIKNGRVLADEVAAALESMDIPVNLGTLQEVMKYTHIDSNNMVDIGDIILTLDELLRDYEDIFMVESPLDETTSNRKILNFPHHRKKATLSPVQSELFFPKLSEKDFQYRRVMDKKDDLKFQRSKKSLQVRKDLDEADSSGRGIQEPHPKAGVDLKKSLEKIETHDSKLEPQNLKIITRPKTSLDKSATFTITELQKPHVRSQPTLPKQVPSKEKPAISALENVYETIHKLQESCIAEEKLQSTLPSVGVTFSDKGFQKVVTDTARDERGWVKLDDFMIALSKEQNLPEYLVLTGVIKATDNIKDEKVDLADLNTCLQNVGIYLSKPEFEKIMECIEPDETNKVNFKDFIDAMVSNTERFSEKLLLPDIIENLHNLSKEDVNVSDLWNTLSSLNHNLKKDEFLAALELAAVGEGDKVRVKQLADVVKDMCDTSRLDELQKVVSAVDLLEDNMVSEKNLEHFLRNIGVKSPEKEVEKILQSDFVSEDGMVNVKDCMKVLRDTQKNSNFIALNEVIDTLDNMKKNSQFDKSKYIDVFANTGGINFTDDSFQGKLDDYLQDLRKEALSPNLKLPTADDIREVINILSQVDNDKINIPNLKHVIESLNVNLTEEDLNEALQHCDINDKQEVDFKDFLNVIKKNSHFKESITTQLLLAVVQILQNDLIDVSNLKSLLINEDLPVACALLKEVLKNVPENENAKINIQDFRIQLENTLITLKVEGDKDHFYNISIHRDDPTAISKLQKNLSAIGIYLPDEKIKETLDNTNVNDEEVIFKDFIKELANTNEFIECQRIDDACNIINNVSDGKVKVKDLSSVLENLERPLNKEQLEVLLDSTTDDEGKVNLKHVIDVFMDSPRSSAPLSNLYEEMKTLDKIRNDKMPVDELRAQLLNIGVPLSTKTFQEILSQASVDENSDVSLKQILETLNTSKPVPASKDIDTALNTVNLMTTDRIHVDDLKDALDHLNVSVKPEEHQMLEEIFDVDEKGDVSLMSVLLALKNNRRFQDFRDVNEFVKILPKVANERADVYDIKCILNGLGISIPEEDLEKVLASTYVDNEGKVDLKDCLTNLLQTSHFIKVPELEGPMKTLTSIRKNLVNADDLPSLMKNVGAPLSQDVIQEALKNMPLLEDGKVNLEEFMTNLINLGYSSLPKRDDSKLDIFPSKERIEMTEGKVDINNVDAVLKNMDVKLTEEEKQDLLEYLSATGSMLCNSSKPHMTLLLHPKISFFFVLSLWDLIMLEFRALLSSSFYHFFPTEREHGSSCFRSAEGDEYTDMKTLIATAKMLKGEVIDIKELDDILKNMGVELNKEELEMLKRSLPADDKEKMCLKTLMDTVQVVTGGEIDLRDVGPTIRDMGINLTPRQQLELDKLLSANATANGKTYRNRLLSCVTAVRELPVNGNGLDTILENMAIKLSGGELDKASDGVINTTGQETLGKKSVDGGKVKRSRVNSFLENVGVKLTEKELEKLMEDLPFSDKEEVDLDKLMDGVAAVTGKEVDLDMLMGGVQAVTGEKIDRQSVPDFVSHMGIALTDSEQQQLLRTLPVDASGKISQTSLRESLKSFKGGKVKRSRVNSFLENVGVKLTEKELEKLMEDLPFSDKEEVDLDKLMDAVKAVTDKEEVDLDKLVGGIQAVTGEKIDRQSVPDFVSHMGIALTDSEQQQLLRTLPVDASGKISQTSLRESLKSFKGGKVKRSRVNSFLENVGVKLTEKELEKLMEDLPFSDKEEVDLDKLMDAVKAVTGEKIDRQSVPDFVSHMGIALTDSEQQPPLRTLPVDASGMISQTSLRESVKSFKGGKVKRSRVNSFLENVGVKLTEKELETLMEDLPFSGECRSHFSAFQLSFLYEIQVISFCNEHH